MQSFSFHREHHNQNFVKSNSMIKAQLVAEIASKTGYRRAEVSDILSAAGEIIQDQVAEGDTVSLRGFGSFVAKLRKEKVARNIIKNTTVVIPERHVVCFRPAADFSNKLK